MNVKKNSVAMLLAIVLALLLTACQTYKAYTFNIETGDQIKIQLDTTGGHNLKQADGEFTVEQNNETVSRGIFLTRDMYYGYVDGIPQAADATILDEGVQGGNEYMLYFYNGEYNIVLWVDGANTGVGVSCAVSQETAMEIFEKLTIEKV